ncbi:PAS domain-containing protein [Fulvivirga ligni]|nr:PAS domain-containing protein [Fulvivirga ligni]
MENIPGMAYSCSGDQNRTIQFVSSASLELTGYSPEDFKKESTTNFTKLILPEDREYVWNTIERSLKKKQPFEVNYRIKTKGGTIKEIVERGQGVFDQNGQLLSVEGILLDVSHQKALESDLNKSRMNLLHAQDVANIGSWELDLTTKEMLWSDQLFKICGAKRAEFKPSIETAISFVHPSDRKKLETKLKGIDKKEFRKQTEFRIVRADGVVRFTQVRTELSKDGNTLLGTMQDITESKLAEVALKESEARNKALLKAIPDMIFTHQVDGTFLDFELPENTSLNVSRAQVVGKDLEALFPKNIANTLQKKFLAAYKTNSGQSLEFELILDNDRKYFEARIVKHKLGQVLSIIRDVTKAKQDELNAAQSLKSFYTAFHISPIAVTISHLKNGELIDVNQRFADLVKLEREDIIGKTSLDLNFWKTEHSRKDFVGELNKNKRVYDYEAEIRVSDGSFKDVVLSAEIITIAEESAILLMISDISVRKKK